jgi:hypothetical protein
MVGASSVVSITGERTRRFLPAQDIEHRRHAEYETPKRQVRGPGMCRRDFAIVGEVDEPGAHGGILACHVAHEPIEDVVAEIRSGGQGWPGRNAPGEHGADKVSNGQTGRKGARTAAIDGLSPGLVAVVVGNPRVLEVPGHGLDGDLPPAAGKPQADDAVGASIRSDRPYATGRTSLTMS